MSNVTDRNIQTLSEALKQVRAALDAQHKVNEALRKELLQVRNETSALEQRLNQIVVRLYSGGATSGNNH